MALFGSRSLGYKVGMLGVFACYVIYLVGYAAPMWITIESVDTKVMQGLWMNCITSPMLVTCSSLETARLLGWFHAVRLMESVGMLLMLIACIYAIVVNCCSSAPRHTRALEILALVGGILAFTGAMVFVGKYSDNTQFSNAETNLAWAFYLATISSVGVILAAVIIFITNKPLNVSSGTPGVVLSGVATQ